MREEERIIVALDVPSKQAMRSLLKKLNQPGCFVKVGMELFYQNGADIIRELSEEGYRTFLDLKLHDIPNTVRQAMKGLAKVGADMVNVHAAGGSAMMRAAIEGLEEGANGKRPICLAVTQLTSTDQAMLTDELLIDRPIADVIASYGKMAFRAGMDGVVCSAWEARAMKEATGSSFLAVTPGIRLAEDGADDQKRVATPRKARSLGSDYLVVGRSITQAQDPKEAFERVLADWRLIYEK